MSISRLSELFDVYDYCLTNFIHRPVNLEMLDLKFIGIGIFKLKRRRLKFKPVWKFHKMDQVLTSSWLFYIENGWFLWGINRMQALQITLYFINYFRLFYTRSDRIILFILMTQGVDPQNTILLLSLPYCEM